jgi:hypothetical protein
MVVHEHEFLVYIDIDEAEIDDGACVCLFLLCRARSLCDVLREIECEYE